MGFDVPDSNGLQPPTNEIVAHYKPNCSPPRSSQREPPVHANGFGIFFDLSIWPSGLHLRHSRENCSNFHSKSLCMRHKQRKFSSPCLLPKPPQKGWRTTKSSRQRLTEDSVYRTVVVERGTPFTQYSPQSSPAVEVRMVNVNAP